MDIFDLNSYDYSLPERLIANTLREPRDRSRLMVLDRGNAKISYNNIFADIVELIDGDVVLVMNNTKVFSARVVLPKKGRATLAEMLFYEEIGEGKWKVLCKPAKRVRTGDMFVLFHKNRYYDFTVLEELEGGGRVVDTGMAGGSLINLLEEAGLVPLPPYINQDWQRDYKFDYQTVYAKELGSVAAPTAGFHFTKQLIADLEFKGVVREEVTLHVGPGTFMPVRTEDIRGHEMHRERILLDQALIERLNDYKKAGKKILAVGTTSVRWLETLATDEGLLKFTDNHEFTDIFIYPGYKFKFVDQLITIFHLPKSTLLMLVAAFLGDGGKFGSENESLKFLLESYKIAIKNNFRFYSFGDAMYIK